MSDNLTPTTVRLSHDIAARLKLLAQRSPFDQSLLMRAAIEEKVVEWEKAGKIEITLQDAPSSAPPPTPPAGEVSYRRARKGDSGSGRASFVDGLKKHAEAAAEQSRPGGTAHVKKDQ